MTHITLTKKTTSKPSLEFFSDDNGEARRVSIENFPFRIGRAETADLRVEAAEISREHAEIVERNGVWLVRDLGSTNGTTVNGTTVKEMILSDGDILKVAETELTFVTSAASQFQRMVTQPIHSAKPAVAASALPDEIAAARMMTEATLWQVIPTQLLAAVSLRHSDTHAFFAPRTASAKQWHDQPNPVYDRYRELERMKAVESALQRTDSTRLFLSVDAAEVDTPHRLFSSLKQLTESLTSGLELGITISLPVDVDVLRISDVYHEARDQGFLVAFDEFQGNGGQVMHLQSLAPDFLVLSASMIKDLTLTRQPLRRLESLFSACEELMIKPVLPNNEAGNVLPLCQEIGFDLVLRRVSAQAADRTAQVSITV